MNPNVNDFQNTNTQPILNNQFIDINAHPGQNFANHNNPFVKAPGVQQNLNFTNDAAYAPPASEINQGFPQQQQQGFQPQQQVFQPQQQGFSQQPQYGVNQGFQTFPNATVQMNAGPQVTYIQQQPGIQVVQPSVQVVTHQPSYTVTTGPRVVVMGGGTSYGTTTINTTVNGGQQAAKFIVLFFFIFFFIFFSMMKAIVRF